VKRCGREEPMCVVIHMCMEAMLGISLYSYLYLKLEKMLYLSYYLLCFPFSKIGEQEGGIGSARGWGRVGKQYVHVSKCKNDKKKSQCFSSKVV
jgi:hypothetical protein